MTQTTQIRAAIVDCIETIPSVGKVYAYERYAAQTGKLKDLYLNDGKILGWNVRRIRFNRRSIADAVFMCRTTWQVQGYMSLDDEAESELVFDALAELVQLQLSDDPSFGGLTTWPDDYEIRAELEPVMFCGILCHSVTITFDTLHHDTSTITEQLDEFKTLHAQYDLTPHASSAEHDHWLEEPPNHSNSTPDLQQTVTLQE